jgi:hypothetical protein
MKYAICPTTFSDGDVHSILKETRQQLVLRE